jgi:hypothetical protein
MQICVRIKNVYGVDKVYPACPAAESFAGHAETKTLTPNTLRQIKSLGFEVVELGPTHAERAAAILGGLA